MEKLIQAGAIPFRRRGGSWEYLLVTSKGGNWIFPKGIVEPGEDPEETAAKECREEAGIRGRILPYRVGTYVQSKWKHDCHVLIYLLQYEEYAEPWEEQHLRDRRWFTYREALERLKKDELRELLKTARHRLEALDYEQPPPARQTVH